MAFRLKIMEFHTQIAGIDNDKRVWSSNLLMFPAPDIGDGDLMLRICAGDEEAFTFVFRRWQGPLFRFALHMCGNRTVAEDATQEVFMTLIRQTRAIRFRKGKAGRFSVRHRAESGTEAFERERSYTALDPNGEDVSDSRAGSQIRSINNVAGSDEAFRAEKIELVRQAIPTLPPDYREVVALCDLEEMSYDR